MVALSIPTPAVTHERAVQSGDSSRSADYRAITTQYREPLLRRSVMQLVATIVPFCVLWVAMWFSLQYSYLLVLALSVPGAGCLSGCSMATRLWSRLSLQIQSRE